MKSARAVENKPIIDMVLNAGEKHGVHRAGVCQLGDLSHLIECRGLSQLPREGSVITILLPYYTGEHPIRNVSLYAVPDDYHRIAGAIMEDIITPLRRLFPSEAWLPFVDSSPIPEVEAAELAGLGFRGRHNQLITPEYGSLTFICELVTSLVIEPNERATGSCGECWRCVDACPTGALWQDSFDKLRCRSELTQRKGELTAWEQHQIALGGLAWGCDICTEACPHNARPHTTTVPQFMGNLLPQLDIDQLDTQMTQKSYIWRGKAVLRRNLGIIALSQNSERK